MCVAQYICYYFLSTLDEKVESIFAIKKFTANKTARSRLGRLLGREGFHLLTVFVSCEQN